MQNTATTARAGATALPTSAQTTRDIEFFFDCSCVWAYLALEQLRRLSGELNLGIVMRPVIATEVFAQVNASVEWTLPPAKQAYYERDLKVWAAYLDMPLAGGAATVASSERCMLACAAAARWGRGQEFATGAFDAAWARGKDIADGEVLAGVWKEAGLQPETLMPTLAWPDTAQDLRDNSRELMKRGGFGVPTFFLDDEMFFGNDAFPLLESAVKLKLRSAGYAF